MDPVTILGAVGSVVGIAAFGLKIAQFLDDFIGEVGFEYNIAIHTKRFLVQRRRRKFHRRSGRSSVDSGRVGSSSGISPSRGEDHQRGQSAPTLLPESTQASKNDFRQVFEGVLED